MTDQFVSVIIPVFNDEATLNTCLQALGKSTYRNLKIIVVDHGPTDIVTKTHKSIFPDITFLRGSSELWWTGATNIGIKYALENGSSLIMLLNHDCYTHPDTIEVLVNKINNNPDSIIAPTQYIPATKKQVFTATTCFLLGFPTIIWPKKWHRLSDNTKILPTPLILGGRGVIIPVKVFNDLGFFDEVNLPHYGADHDFYIRCRKNGIPLFICPQSTVIVDPASTSSAESPEKLSVKEFIATFHSRKSHKNIPDLVNLYKKHYPIKHLFMIGVTLNILRYIALFSVKRVLFLLRREKQ